MISIIVTCFNESEIINEFIVALNKETIKINEKFEIIFVDNKSNDDTLKIIKESIKIFNNYKIISLSNYFGKESGILAGLDNSDGDAIIIMDPDLEDPPELIKDLIKKWKEGYEVVYAKRNKTKLPLYKSISKKIFYKIFKMSINKEFNIPSNTGDYRILDKKIKNILTSMRERTRFLRGLISYIGFKQTGIFFDRPIRKKGKSKSSMGFLIKYGMDALLSSTGAPIGIITKIGIFSLLSISIFILIVIIIKIFFNPPLGFSLTALFILFLFSFNTLLIGIVGEYVTRIYDEVKTRPNYIIEDIIKKKD
jgi:dolichol-phosphate mannosyltransferase|tara:strand:- start:1786 stop:2712 length:927 start_codon:yes stop_codon:yes gene_type:complete